MPTELQCYSFRLYATRNVLFQQQIMYGNSDQLVLNSDISDHMMHSEYLWYSIFEKKGAALLKLFQV